MSGLRRYHHLWLVRWQVRITSPKFQLMQHSYYCWYLIVNGTTLLFVYCEKNCYYRNFASFIIKNSINEQQISYMYFIVESSPFPLKPVRICGC